MRSWSISRRLVVTLVVLIGGIWLAGSGIAALMIRHEIDEVFDSSLQETAQRLLPLALDDLRRRDREDDEESERTLVNPFSAEEHEEYLHYQVRDAQGDVLLRSHDASAEPFPAPLKRGYFDDGDRRYFTEVAPDRTTLSAGGRTARGTAGGHFRAVARPDGATAWPAADRCVRCLLDCQTRDAPDHASSAADRQAQRRESSSPSTLAACLMSLCPSSRI